MQSFRLELTNHGHAERKAAGELDAGEGRTIAVEGHASRVTRHGYTTTGQRTAGARPHEGRRRRVRPACAGRATRTLDTTGQADPVRTAGVQGLVGLANATRHATR